MSDPIPSLTIFFPVNGVPLRVLGPQDGSPEEVKNVKDATAEGKYLVIFTDRQ